MTPPTGAIHIVELLFTENISKSFSLSLFAKERIVKGTVLFN